MELSTLLLFTEHFGAYLYSSIIPVICKYFRDEYNIEVSEDTVASVLSIPKQSRKLAGVSRKGKIIDEINGCQYIMDRSKKRGGRRCGEKRNENGYFCASCMKKRMFGKKAEQFAQEQGISLLEAVGDRERYEAIMAKNSSDENTLSSRPMMDNTLEEMAEEVILEAIPIDGLTDMVTDEGTNLVLYCADNHRIAVGQWNEDQKIVPLSPASKIIARCLSLQIDNYDRYDFAQYKPF